MTRKKKFTAEQVRAVIPGTGGIISTIAHRLGCKWHTARRYIDDHVTVKEAYDAECERVLDRAETVIIDQFAGQDPDVSIAKWYLKMKGEKRGYSQSHTIKGGGEPVEIKVVYEATDRNAQETS